MHLSSKLSLEFCPHVPSFSCLLHRLVLASMLTWTLHMLTVDHCNFFILPAQLIYSKLKLNMALLCFYHISYKCFSGGPHVEKSLRASTVSVTPLSPLLIFIGFMLTYGDVGKNREIYDFCIQLRHRLFATMSDRIPRV